MNNSSHTKHNDIELWFPSDAPEDTIQTAIASCRAAGRRPIVVYRSGTGDLSALTADLLRHNLCAHPTPHD